MEEDAPQSSFMAGLPKQQVLLVAAVLVVAVLVFVSGAWKPLFEVQGNQTQMLIIGQPSPGLEIVLDQDQSLVYYTMRDASQLDISPAQQLEQYDVVLLDQHLGAMPYDHSVSRQLGEELQNFVRTGGKLVVVMDSGIYRSGPEGTVASDIASWKANFDDLMPVECDRLPSEIGSCEVPLFFAGRIRRSDLSHDLMTGIESAPSSPALPPYSVKAFDVRPIGDVVAIIEDDASEKSFPGIVEKKKLLGKVIYFNYDPALSPGIWQNTLEYLR